MSPEAIAALAEGVVAAEKASVARALNLVESKRLVDRPRTAELLRVLGARGKTGSGHRVGLTGPPGVGKSTLSAALARKLRSQGRTVAFVAVDPSSLASGGSLLGDRARVESTGDDPGMFYRSYSTGGDAGGLTFAAHSAISVLSAAFDVVLVETTGVGQTETDVTLVADTVALVLQPGSGDTLQFLKAGIMEIPDVLVVQKADHEALARAALADLGSALRAVRQAGIGPLDATWEAPAVATSARTGLGVDELVSVFEQHRRALGAELRERRARGSVGWAIRDFVRLHGSYGVRVLGGTAALAETLRHDHECGAPAAELAARASERYLDAVRNAAR